jgi:hypothetical protein
MLINPLITTYLKMGHFALQPKARHQLVTKTGLFLGDFRPNKTGKARQAKIPMILYRHPAAEKYLIYGQAGSASNSL